MNAALLAIRAVRAPQAPAWLLALAGAERGGLLPWLAVLTVGGALAYFALDHEPAAYVGPALASGAAGLAVLLRTSAAGRAAALALLAAACGFASAQWATARAPALPDLPRTATVVTATVLAVEQLPDGRRLLLGQPQLDGGPALPRTLHIRVRAKDTTPLAAGDAVRVRSVLRPPASPAYPGGWDLQRDAFFSGLGGAGMALGPVERTAPAASSHWITQLREAVAARVMAGLPGTDGAVAATMLTGLGTTIPLADRAAFRDAGLAHLLAVAGLHLGIVMGLVLAAARFALSLSERAALRWPCKQMAAGAALLAGAGYVLLTGVHVPVLRSFAMASLLTLGVVVGRRAISLRGLALAAMVLVLLWPAEVVGVSFQMSFAAVLALIAGYEAINPLLVPLRRRRAALHGAMLVLTSLLAGVAAAPFGAYHFGRIQLYFVLANLLAVPLTALAVLPAGLLALLLMPLGWERLALVPMGWGLDAVLFVARTVAALPAATVGVPHMPAWGLAVAALGLAWLCLLRSRLRLAGVAVALAGLLSGLVSPPADLLVSADARLIAWRSPPLVQTRPGFAPFVLQAWSQYWAEPLEAPFPENGPPGAIHCDRDGCRMEHAGATVLLARSLHPMDCTGVSAVVASDGARAVCPALPHIDRSVAWQEGAHAVWLRAGGAEIVSDRGYRGDRPWVAPPPGQARTTLPLAAVDTGD